MKFFDLRLTRVVALAGVVALVGCQGSSQPEATSTDELTQFLNDNPELKEPKEDVPASDPTKAD
ncbi:hypothetical protein LOC71_17505 [Rhodopirellula sp. JC740]|uniref:Secreted protein n=1 Tax=Rhodopirellula halodulae TaxID=2894198 RepID=A0ABS8NKJ5_9BACT|nr:MULTISPECIES: hypothetical protein [unclassified Rhodopirellula]MCC9644082.1 hypothetical protein [Rhodopirellula sp. JC740]MCC9657244.1 hypothetical protein [Rhodopirellula sp. JC737]